MQRIQSEIKGFLLFLAILLVVVLADILAVYLYYNKVESFVNSQPENPKGDAGIVFFGDYGDDSKLLGYDSKKRAAKAIEIYRMKAIRKVVCVGGYNYRLWKGKPHLMKKFLVENQVSPNDIIYDSASYNTITNWQEALKIINQYHFDTVVAVSSPLHIFRISQMIKFPHTYFATYAFHLQTFDDYWVLYRNIHHEFLSQILNRILKDEIRNKISLVYGFISNQLDQIF
jgi:uncharacterized SAM-binding protein YcdF (DUF218 family)